MDPFNLTGPEFLILYGSLFVIVLCSALFLRRYLRQPDGEPPPEAAELGPYEIVYVAGGERMVFNTALAVLVQRGALVFETRSGEIGVADCAKGNEGDPIETAVFEAVFRRSIRKLKGINTSIPQIIQRLAERPREMGLIPSEGQTLAARMLPGLLMLALAGFGLVKILVGVARDKPVAFLVMASISTAVGAIIFWARPVFRSQRGDTALEALRSERAALKLTAQSNLSQVQPPDLILALGLFGLGILETGGMRNFYKGLFPSGNSAGGCGGGCGGDGGGGGCGGGCGGCGGG